MALADLDINAAFAADDGNDNASKKWMIYLGDDGATKYRVFITESIGAILGFDDITDANQSTTVAMPTYFKMRLVNFSDASGKVKGSYPVGKATEDIFKEGGKIKVARKGKADGVQCFATGVTGESRRFFYTGDTGQQSGDAT